MSIGYASIYLENEKCVGCTRCMQRCPTEAIRIRDGKATILRERCVDCGECIRVCPRHAMKARVDTLSEALGKYKYTIALPAQALYGQFPGVRTRAPILEGLLRIGFDSVFEVAAAAEVMSAVTHYELNYGSIPHPIITTDCPVILRIVRIRFPSLLPHLLNYRSPMEVAARWSKRLAMKETGLSEEDIGCVYISPCPAKCAGAKAALGTARPAITGVVSIAEVAPRLTAVMGDIDDHERYAQAGAAGVSWAISGGQSSAAGEPNHLAASGIENIIGILEALEDGKLSHVDLIELNACYPGCVGGALAVENPFIAKARLQQMMRDTTELMGASEASLGTVHPDNTSAIIAVQSATAAPLELTKMEFYRFTEDWARIFLDMMGVHYGVRTLVLPDEDGGEPQKQSFDFSSLAGQDMNLQVDIGAASYWSEIMQTTTNDHLLE